jgi:hypothetical protein
MSLDLSSLSILKDSNEMIDFICWANHILRRVTNCSHPVIVILFKTKLCLFREKKKVQGFSTMLVRPSMKSQADFSNLLMLWRQVHKVIYKKNSIPEGKQKLVVDTSSLFRKLGQKRFLNHNCSKNEWA